MVCLTLQWWYLWGRSNNQGQRALGTINAVQFEKGKKTLELQSQQIEKQYGGGKDATVNGRKPLVGWWQIGSPPETKTARQIKIWMGMRTQ